MTKDGWHKIKGCEVFVENGKVVRGIRLDSNGERVTAYPYKYDSTYSTWCKGAPSISAFKGSSWELK